MQIALLGPLDVCDDAGAHLDVAGRRLRRLVARLALDPGRLVTTEALVDAIWDDRPPAGAAGALQSLVWRLRRSLGSGGPLLESLPAGYRLRIVADAVDVGQFERLAAEGRAARDAGDLTGAAGRFTRALGLWRGTPLADLGPVAFATTAVVRLEELRLHTIEDWAEVSLGRGQADEAIGELAELTVAHPLRERMRELHMRALWAAGRPAEALASYEALRRTLGEELGVDPSQELRDLHSAILLGGACATGPPARPAGGQRGGVRFALTSFVGREDELAQAADMLRHGRLVTLVGAGGAGKTRLAVEIARRAQDAGEAAWVVELASVGDPVEVPSAVLDTLGLRGGPGLGPRGTGAAPVELLVDALRDREALVVLDNCEHLLDACARVVDAVLGTCQEVRILATSREPMAITGEVIFPVAPLAAPPATAAVEQALGFPALRLFADRAAAVRPGFTVTAENLAAAGEVCRRLDGLPLAIELACARLRTLPVEEIAARLGDRFRLLAGGSRTALPRHRTMLAALEWSWDLFTSRERALARRLATFAGGATLEAAEAVCAGDDLAAGEVLDVLGALVDRSFVELTEVRGGRPRYRMLETVRAYAEAMLHASGESDQVRRAHAAHFLARAETAEPALRGADQLRWLSWLTGEYDNLAAALRWAVDAHDAPTAVRLTAALGWFWEMRGSHKEATAYLRDALALASSHHSGAVPVESLAAAYAFDAMHRFVIQDPEAATRSALAARHLAEEGAATHPAVVLMISVIGQGSSPSTESATAGLSKLVGHSDPWVAAEAELWLAHAAESSGDAPRALAHFASARNGFAAIGDRWGMLSAVSSLGTGYGLDGDHAAAIAALSEAERLAGALGAADEASRMRVRCGMERLRAGHLTDAHADFTRAREAAHAHRSAQIVALADVGLGELARVAGDLAEARTRLTGALARLDRVRGLPSHVVEVPALTGLGRVAVAAGDLADARARLGAGLRLALCAADGPSVAVVAEAVAELAVAEADYGEAARLLGLAAAARGASDRGSPDVACTESTARAALAGSFDAVYTAAAGLGAAGAAAALSTLDL